MKKINVMQIMPDFGLAGAETMCEALCYELVKTGMVDLTVVSLFNYHSAITERLERFGINVVFLNKKAGLDLRLISSLKKLMLQKKTDVIHTHRYVKQYAVPAAILAGVPIRIHTVHNIAEKEIEWSRRKLAKLFYQYCNVRPIAISPIVQKTIVEEYSLAPSRIPIVLNGSDLSRCVPKCDYRVAGKFKILHIGRFSEAKNHIGLLEAFHLFHSQYSDSALMLIGDGERRGEIERLINHYGLQNSVDILGLQQNVFGFLHEADIFTLPSIYEGVPITLIEAMGTGLPIVATAVGGVPDMLDSSMAILTSVDSSEIAKAFETYYLSENLRKEHGQRARIKSELFSAKTMAQQYLAEYQGIERK